MTENYIIIEGVNEKVIENILMNMANLYSDTKYVKGMQLYRKKENPTFFLIFFPNAPDFVRFAFFVNYIKYPEGYEKHKPFLRGFYKVTEKQPKAEFTIGEWLMVYVSEKDKEYDNVSFVNERNESFLYDFGGTFKKLLQIEESYKLISYVLNDFHHIIDIYPGPNEEKKPWWRFW